MTEAAFLKDLVIVFAVGVLVVAVLNRFKIPAITGFIVAGMLIGPEGLGLINDSHQVEILAEIGVALLYSGSAWNYRSKKLKDSGVRPWSEEPSRWV
jgi:Kef-type K+ transport system membrane component KefB